MSIRMTLIAHVGATVVRALGWTWRMRWVDTHYLDAARAHAPRVIFVVWHGRLLPLSFSHRRWAIQVLASRHQDGEMLGQIISRLGFGHVRGSSSRGGARAIREMVTKLGQGYDVGFTIDGPRGPRYRVKPGPLEIAKLSGAAIVPITTGSRHHRALSSWDRFEIPYPFSAVMIRYGKPVTVAPDAGPQELEARRLELEQTLREITASSDEEIRG